MSYIYATQWQSLQSLTHPVQLSQDDERVTFGKVEPNEQNLREDIVILIEL